MTDVFYAGIPRTRIAEFERTLECILDNLEAFESGRAG
jgi:hypothetical protein